MCFPSFPLADTVIVNEMLLYLLISLDLKVTASSQKHELFFFFLFLTAPNLYFHVLRG